jgi:hypothetical protein
MLRQTKTRIQISFAHFHIERHANCLKFANIRDFFAGTTQERIEADDLAKIAPNDGAE